MSKAITAARNVVWERARERAKQLPGALAPQAGGERARKCPDRTRRWGGGSQNCHGDRSTLSSSGDQSAISRHNRIVGWEIPVYWRWNRRYEAYIHAAWRRHRSLAATARWRTMRRGLLKTTWRLSDKSEDCPWLAWPRPWVWIPGDRRSGGDLAIEDAQPRVYRLPKHPGMR